VPCFCSITWEPELEKSAVANVREFVYALKFGIPVDSKQALAELGLEAPASTEAIRRAYLRSVRKHPPERDPEGFRRVRQAYELLRDRPWLWGGTLESDAAGSDPVPAASALSASAEPATDVVPTPAQEPSSVEREHESAFFVVPKDEPAAPLPWRDIQKTLQLLEDGKLAEARRLSEALDRRMTDFGMRAREIGAYAIARWTLVGELLALEGAVSEGLIRALAAGVRSGDFEEADIQRGKAGWRVRRALAAKAPSLNKAMLTSAGLPRFRPGFTRWSWIWVGWLVLQLLKFGFGSFVDTKPRPDTAHVVATANASAGQHAVGSPAQQRLVNAARALDEAVQYGDCNTVREQWPLYARGVREAGFAWSRENYAERRQRALEMCAELAGELSEVP
jgi:hypothetical protein